MEGLDVATIGFLSLVGLPYTFKFLWAPLMDRFDLPWLGRRRGWLVLTQLALARHAAAAGGDLADPGDARLRAAGGGGGLHVGVAGRGHRRLPHRPAAGARARPGLVAQRHGLPAGDDPVRRHRADLDRPGAGRRLELADGLPLHGRADVRRGRALGASRCRKAADAGRPPDRGAPRRDRLPGGAGGGGGGLRAQRPARRRRWRTRCSARCSKARRSAPRCKRAGRPAGAAAGHRLHAAAGRLGGAQGALRDAARRPAQLLQPARRGRLPGLHRAVQAGRRLRRLADDALPAEEHGLQPGRGRRGQQDHRPVADHRRRAARRRC